MKKARIFVVKIYEIFVGFLEKDVDYVFPLYYDMKKSFSRINETRYIDKIWGFASIFSYRGKDIKIIDLSIIFLKSKI